MFLTSGDREQYLASAAAVSSGSVMEPYIACRKLDGYGRQKDITLDSAKNYAVPSAMTAVACRVLCRLIRR